MTALAILILAYAMYRIERAIRSVRIEVRSDTGGVSIESSGEPTRGAVIIPPSRVEQWRAAKIAENAAQGRETPLNELL